MVQLLMLLARNAGLVLLAGLLPLAAASGISGSGQAVRNRYLTWLLALVLYKPAAATIYAAVFWLIGDGQTLTDVLTGLVMFCMAIVALPALLRLIAPGVSVLSSGGSASGAGVAAVSAAGQVASGAVRLSNSGGKGSGGAGGHTGGGGRRAPSARRAVRRRCYRRHRRQRGLGCDRGHRRRFDHRRGYGCWHQLRHCGRRYRCRSSGRPAGRWHRHTGRPGHRAEDRWYRIRRGRR
ncbi:hypothetical protein GCM10029963_78220 [Micromonospora andamanensis]